MVVVLVGLASLFQYSYMGPTAGTLQNMLSPRMRATGTAFTSMIYTMGGGIGPVVLGVLSGHYVSRGINSGVALGLAMASMSLLYLWAAGHYCAPRARSRQISSARSRLMRLLCR